MKIILLATLAASATSWAAPRADPARASAIAKVDLPFTTWVPDAEPTVRPFGAVRTFKVTKPDHEQTVDLTLPAYHCYAIVAGVADDVWLGELAVGAVVQPRETDHAYFVRFWDVKAEPDMGVASVSFCNTPHSGKVRLTLVASAATTVAYKIFQYPMQADDQASIRRGRARCLASKRRAAECDSIAWCDEGSRSGRCRPDGVDLPDEQGDATPACTDPQQSAQLVLDDFIDDLKYEVDCPTGGSTDGHIGTKWSTNTTLQATGASCEPCTWKVDLFGSVQPRPGGTCHIRDHQLTCE
ncbi:MAG TPA: hypothetical protein VLX92_20280 [Kofleriaceae bacterium]|nr:hypothetical protein [Kofleriaceae bacterium]